MLRLIPILAALALLLIPAAAHADQDATAPYLAENATDIVDLAVADGRFTTLVTALQAAGLVDTLRSAGPFTVFAPTDDAFAQLPSGTVAGLLGDVPALTSVLLYHVVPGAVSSADVVQLSSADTVAGKSLTIAVDGGSVMINNARVIIPDLAASNGVIHVIDTVLLPPAN
jgi:transforming growth factor-beta-induced protein